MRYLKISELLIQYPFILDFLQQNRLNVSGFEELSFVDYLEIIRAKFDEELAIDYEVLPEELETYISQMQAFLGIDENNIIKILTILPGNDKLGVAEKFNRIDISTSQIVSIVGPTGSGKSRLLADIEWAAQGDTPTKRTILINHTTPDIKCRYLSNYKLVAQLSQNMNFVIDLSVGEFIQMYAESRMIADRMDIVKRVLNVANELAGESFSFNTPVTSLSGGQSRALMIADTALLSSSPIILIDEIENAGIDRKKALEVLISQDKIVLIATHDPLLALMAERRIVIRNGGIYDIIETSDKEKEILLELEKMDAVMQKTRKKLRFGEKLI